MKRRATITIMALALAAVVLLLVNECARGAERRCESPALEGRCP